jgi:hypothetical protein
MAVHGSHARRRFLAASFGAGAVVLIALGTWVRA